MIALTADTLVQALLQGLTDVVQIRDAEGNVLGYYTPAAQAEGLLQEQARKLFDLEEAERIAATEHDGYTIEEVMQYLHSLEPQG